MDGTPFWITRHARERYLERSDKRYARLAEIRDSEEGKLLYSQLIEEVEFRRDEIEREMLERLRNSIEDRSCLNNSMFMGRYYDKFGYDHRFQFLVDKRVGLVYVIVFQDSQRKVVTCIDAKTHIAGRNVLNKPKFRKKAHPQ